MTPAARVQAAIEVVDGWLAGAQGLDRVLTDWGRAHRFAGSGDRRAIADLVYDAVRRMRSALWVAGSEEPGTGRDILRGSQMLDGGDPETLFTGVGHAPEALSDAERKGMRVLEDAPRMVRLDLPAWLEPDLGGVPEAALEALRDRAAVDLRVNRLKATVAEARAALAEEGIETAPLAIVPDAVRVTEGARKVARSRAYREGLVEIQDGASQAVAALAGVRAGERVLDLCAGGGGKSLALAAAMGGRGTVWAHDIAPQRMADLPERARRAGAEITLVPTGGLAALAGQGDLVFVDAPCSGSGAWRRNPDAKWRLTREGLDRVREVQAQLLDQAVGLIAPAGRICYATCSLLPGENAGQIAAFLARHPGWSAGQSLSLTPLDGTDGFFGTVLTKTLGSR